LNKLNPAAEWSLRFQTGPPLGIGIGIGIGSVVRPIPILRRCTVCRL